LVALALIYVLHVAFFDDLMAQGGGVHGKCNSFFTSSQQQSPDNNPPGESSYRLLTKHEQSKQEIGVPAAFDFVSVTFTGFIAEQIKQLQFGAPAHLNVSTFKLYRLFRVFLI